MSTKISFFLPVELVDSEMGFCTADDEMVFLPLPMPPPDLTLSTATGSLWTYIFSCSVDVDWG